MQMFRSNSNPNVLYRRANGSKTLLASFIFKAKYGEPPRSGWFANITLLYLSASFALERARSLLSIIVIERILSTLVPLFAQPPISSFFAQIHLLGHFSDVSVY